MKLNRTLIMSLCIVLAAALAIGGSLAYLQDTDSDVNIMVVGNVKIDQIEQQRVNDADKQHELEGFEQNKAAIPSYYPGSSIPWAAEDEWVVPGDPAWKVVEDNPNVIDKFVTVKNTGATAAFVRTLFAIEVGTGAKNADLMHVVNNAANVTEGPTWAWEWLTDANNEVAVITIGDSDYCIYEAVYAEALAAGDTTIPSLKQLYLDKKATNEDVANYGETYEVLVVSQAVQSPMGTLTPAEALDEAFGNLTEEKAKEWFTGLYPESEAEDAAALQEALNIYGRVITLEKDVFADNYLNVSENGKATVDLNSYTLGTGTINRGQIVIENGTISATTEALNNSGKASLKNVEVKAGSPADYALISRNDSETTYDNVTIDSKGGGVAAADGAKVTFNSGSLAVNTTSTSGRYLFYTEGAGSEITINGGTFSFSKTLNQKRAYIYAGADTTVYVTGGTFGPASTRSGYTAGILGSGTVIITGGTFGFDPTAWVADGYKVTVSGSNWIVSAE